MVALVENSKIAGMTEEAFADWGGTKLQTANLK